MKIRTGFVSNSSSSSFVLLGFKITEERSEEYENYEDFKWRGPYSIEYIEETKEYYVGIKIASWDGYELIKTKVQKSLKMLNEFCDKYNFDVDSAEIISGAVYS